MAVQAAGLIILTHKENDMDKLTYYILAELDAAQDFLHLNPLVNKVIASAALDGHNYSAGEVCRRIGDLREAEMELLRGSVMPVRGGEVIDMTKYGRAALAAHYAGIK